MIASSGCPVLRKATWKPMKGMGLLWNVLGVQEERFNLSLHRPLPPIGGGVQESLSENRRDAECMRTFASGISQRRSVLG